MFLPGRLVIRCSLALIIVAFVAGCQIGEKKVTTVTEDDAGKTIRIKKNEDLQVVVIGDPQSNLQWDAEGYDPALLKPHTPVKPGDKVFLGFDVLARGTTPIRLVYHQPDRPDVPPAKSFDVTVVIQ